MIEWITNNMLNSGPVLAAIMGMAASWLLLPVIITVSHKKHLVDEPTGIRKIHSNTTPNLGGVAFYFSLVVIFLISGYTEQIWTSYLFAGLTVLFFSGVKDDILILSAGKKLVLQILAASFLTVGGNLVITDLGGVFGIMGISYWSGLLLTTFTVIVVINAYNLIDGIDGLAGTIGLLVCLFFGGWFWSVGYMSHAILAFICVGTLMGFLAYNFYPATIFMGDTGSQVMGYMLAFFAVSFVKIGVTSSTYVPFQNAVPILALSVLIVPLYDTLRVFTLRAMRKGSPFKADRLHIHHQLLDFGFSDKGTCYIILALNLTIIGLTLLLKGLNVNILLGIVLLSSAILFPTTGFKRIVLGKVGIDIPSARRIRHFERKYGFESETSGSQSQQEKDWDKVAV